MKKTIYIFSSGELHRKQNTLYFESEEGKKKYVPVENTKEIMVYDINEKRVNKVLKIGLKYLSWMQNSVLEGEITEAKFVKLKGELKSIIEKGEDSIIFYKLRTKRYFARETMGMERGLEEQII
jgi:CRISPR-associated protein Cas2